MGIPSTWRLSADVKELCSVVFALVLVGLVGIGLVVTEWELPFLATYGVLAVPAIVGYALSHWILFSASRPRAKRDLESTRLPVPRDPAA